MGDEADEFKIRTSWVRDLMPIGMLLVSGLVWGMKLEARADRNEERTQIQAAELAAIRAEISRGILPLTSERLTVINHRLAKIERDCFRYTEEMEEDARR